MNQNNIGTASSALQAVVYQFENWRATRGKRGRILDALWALVAPLMEKYSHNEIASALRLNHGQLKEHVLPLSSQMPNKSATFMEYSLPSPSSSVDTCNVNLN